MPGLIFEIGLEEMPARFIKPSMEALAKSAQAELKAGALSYDKLSTHGTPRRLALLVEGLAESQPDREETMLGPPVKNAFDPDGNPTKAAQGFARSQKVEVSELSKIDTDKGQRLGLVKKVVGRPAAQVLAEILPGLIGGMHFPKAMRWGTSGQFRYARPIHWLLAVLDGEVIPFEMAGLKSGNLTRGHRFMAPEFIEIKDASKYLTKLREAYVIADRKERMEITRREVASAASQAGGGLVPDEDLLLENTDLVEFPNACSGSFDKEFLEVPREVVISAMRDHQRYFALEDESGKLLPGFVAVNNTRPKDMSVVVSGHQRVLRARLADARFFLDEDMKAPLAKRLDELKNVTYHAKLGSSFEKAERFTKLAEYLAGQMAPELSSKCVLTARLAKCDLVTEMVGEFPSLQGVIGAEYARRNGEDPQVAQGISDHYLPAGADSPLPEGMVGSIVGLADRLDTICGMYAIGQIPTGQADPYALRRAAIGVIRILKEKRLAFSLNAALDLALKNLADKLEAPAEEVKAQVLEFMSARFLGILSDEGVPTDVAQAVLAAGFDDPAAAHQRALALAKVKDTPDFMPLAIGMKRVMNILRKEADQVPDTAPDESLMNEEAERALHKAFGELADQARELFGQGDYLGFLIRLSGLKGPIDDFFDQVMVMVEDEAVRHNRLALLNQIAGLFGKLAQFTHLQLA